MKHNNDKFFDDVCGFYEWFRERVFSVNKFILY